MQFITQEDLEITLLVGQAKAIAEQQFYHYWVSKDGIELQGPDTFTCIFQNIQVEENTENANK